MYTIEVDFDVLKALMARRTTEDTSNNDVIRDLLKLGEAKQRSTEAAPAAVDWVVKGVRFPVGTEFRGKHRGTMHSARVDGGRLLLNGKRHDSPSAAACAITGHPTNGWTFWEVRTPGGEWRPMVSFRKGN